MKDMFIPREQWEEYDLTKSMDKILFARKEKEWFCYGFWPLLMAISFSKEKPVVPKKGGLRLWPRVHVWDRLVKKDGDEEGWTKVGRGPRKKLGVLEVRNAEYYTSWGDTTKNLRNRWLKLNGAVYEVAQVERDVFLKEYKESDIYKRLSGDIVKRVMESVRKRDMSGTLPVRFLLIRKKETGEYRAGMAYELSTSSTNTYYSVGFLKDRKEKDPLMTGLFMEWIEKERKNGYVYFNFGAIWQKGDPKSWQGFSDFKMKHGLKVYELPQSLIKVRW